MTSAQALLKPALDAYDPKAAPRMQGTVPREFDQIPASAAQTAARGPPWVDTVEKGICGPFRAILVHE